jgi:ribosomal protein S18 acetylase RimI-like enzyme
MSQQHQPIRTNDPSLPASVSANFAEEMACFGRVIHGAELREDAELLWFAVTPTLNGVLRSRFTPDDPAYIKQRIQAIIEYYTKRQARSFGWTLDLASQPAHLKELLLAQDFTHVYDGDIMTLALPAREQNVIPSPTLAIREVSNAQELQQLCDVEQVAFESTADRIKLYYQTYLASGFGPDQAWRHFTGSLDGRVVASASLLLSHGVAGIYGIGTLPEARRQGVAASMILHVLNEAEHLGYHVATLSPTEQSKRLYQRIGFRTLGQKSFYKRSLA